MDKNVKVDANITNKILNKAKIGLWSIEIEEKKQPRLYLQDFILNVISVKKHGNENENLQLSGKRCIIHTDAMIVFSKGKERIIG